MLSSSYSDISSQTADTLAADPCLRYQKMDGVFDWRLGGTHTSRYRPTCSGIDPHGFFTACAISDNVELDAKHDEFHFANLQIRSSPSIKHIALFLRTRCHTGQYIRCSRREREAEPRHCNNQGSKYSRIQGCSTKPRQPPFPVPPRLDRLAWKLNVGNNYTGVSFLLYFKQFQRH